MKLLGLVFGFCNAHFRIQRAAKGVAWDFNDQGNSWPTLFPDECAADKKRQSPIDIKDDILTNKPYEKFNLYGYDNVIDWKSENNGKGILITTNDTNTPDISFTGGGLDGKYNFAQFHFHWGSETENGAEHTFNGNRHFAEVHLVHWKDSYGNITTAIGNGDGLAVLGFTIEVAEGAEGELDSFIQSKEGKLESVNSSMSVEDFKLASMLPAVLGDFYRYEGSLTTPKCNEAVMWTVFKDPLKITPKTKTALLEAVNNADGSDTVKIYRVAQDLNGRKVHFYSDSNDPESSAAALGLSVITLLFFLYIH